MLRPADLSFALGFDLGLDLSLDLGLDLDLDLAFDLGRARFAFARVTLAMAAPYLWLQAHLMGGTNDGKSVGACGAARRQAVTPQLEDCFPLRPPAAIVLSKLTPLRHRGPGRRFRV